MRKAVLAIVFLASLHVVSGQSQSSPSSGDKAHAQDTKKPEPKPTTPESVVVIQQETAANQNDRANNAPKSYFSRLFAPENLPNDILCLVGIGGIIVAVFTLVIINRQTKATEASVTAVVASERSWILVSTVGNPAENWLASNNPSYSPGIIFEFKVFGNTTVKLINGAFDLILVSRKANPPWPEPDLPEIPDYAHALRLPDSGTVLPPQGTFQVHRIFSLSQEARVSLVNREKILCGYGYLKYIDAFGKERETRACYVYHLQSGGVITGPDGVVLNPDGFRVGGPSEYNRAT